MTRLIDEDTGLDVWHKDEPVLLTHRLAAKLLEVNYHDVSKLPIPWLKVEKLKAYWRHDLKTFLRHGDPQALQLLAELQATRRAVKLKERNIKRRGPRLKTEQTQSPFRLPASSWDVLRKPT
jgi:hypothetical protein